MKKTGNPTYQKIFDDYRRLTENIPQGNGIWSVECGCLNAVIRDGNISSIDIWGREEDDAIAAGLNADSMEILISRICIQGKMNHTASYEATKQMMPEFTI